MACLDVPGGRSPGARTGLDTGWQSIYTGCTSLNTRGMQLFPSPLGNGARILGCVAGWTP